MTSRAGLALVLGALAWPTGVGNAQDGRLRARVVAWADSIERIEDTALLRGMHREALTRADSLRGDPEAELRLGLVALRLAEFTGERRLIVEAGRSFAAITEDHPDWPLGWTGLAEADLAEAREGLSLGFGFQQLIGMDPAAKVVRTLVRGTGPDSSHTDGLLRMARRALRSRDRLDEQVALRALRAMPVRLFADDADLALMRARVEREVGEKDSAHVVIERTAQLHPSNPLVLRAQAQYRFVVGRADGAAPWYRGLQRADASALARFVRDLQMVVPDSVMGRLLTARPGDRAEIVRGFWRGQDPDGLPTEDDRLAEHYRRLEFARRNYVRHSVIDTVRWFEYDTLGIAAFDARGEMMLRHGSPRVRTSIGDHGGPNVEVTLRIIGMPPNESWTYDRTDGTDQFYHFVRPGRDQDFVAVESILDILAYSEQFRRFRPGLAPLVRGDTTHRTILVHGAELVSIVAQELLVSRHAMSPLYKAMIDEGMAAADSIQRVERAIGRESLARPYTYELGFEMPLDAAFEILAVGSDQRGPLLQVSFAVAGSDLTPQAMPRGVVYPLRMRAAVTDANGRVVAQVDTVRGFLAPARLGASQQLVGQLPIRVPPGTYRVRASLESERRGVLSRPVRVTVPAAANPLSLSDVSIGVRSVPILWRSPTADTAWVNPRGRFRADEEMQLYFEVAGVAEGTRYRTQIAIDRAEEVTAGSCSGRGTAFTLSFEGEHPGRVAREQRALSLNRLRPGDYVIAVTVSTEGGERATRCRRFTVVRE